MNHLIALALWSFKNVGCTYELKSTLRAYEVAGVGFAAVIEFTVSIVFPPCDADPEPKIVSMNRYLEISALEQVDNPVTALEGVWDYLIAEVLRAADAEANRRNPQLPIAGEQG